MSMVFKQIQIHRTSVISIGDNIQQVQNLKVYGKKKAA